MAGEYEGKRSSRYSDMRLHQDDNRAVGDVVSQAGQACSVVRVRT